MNVTIAMAYYENPKMLRVQLDEWRAYRPQDKQQLSAIIVDDGSPRNPAKAVLEAFGNVGFDIKLFRVGPNLPWNQDGARNLAMKNVETDWALLTDMDHMLARADVPRMLHAALLANVGAYYMPGRVDYDGRLCHSHANSYLFCVRDFWRMGGYDEDFQGVYGSDGNFRKCARAVLREVPTNQFRLTRWPSDAISDANTKDWGRKDSSYHRSQHPKIEAKSKGPAYKAERPIRFEWERVF